MNSDRYKKKQIDYYKKKFEKFAFSPDTGVIEDYFSSLAIRMVVDLLPFDYKDKKILISCGGGEGYEIKEMLGRGAKVVVSDISKEALDTARSICPQIDIVVADAEKLPFKANSFDFAMVKDGLHHLEDPYLGIKELFRISSDGFFIIDFQETFITRILIKLGISPEFEEAGNRNFKFKRGELEKFLEKLGVKKYKIKSFFMHAPVFSFPIFNNKVGLFFVSKIMTLLNILISKWGNVLIVAASNN